MEPAQAQTLTPSMISFYHEFEISAFYGQWSQKQNSKNKFKPKKYLTEYCSSFNRIRTAELS